MRHDLPLLLSLMVRLSLLMTPFRFVLWRSLYFLLTLLFAEYYLLILASFLTSLHDFLDSLDAFYFLLSLAALSLSFQPIFTRKPLHELEL